MDLENNSISSDLIRGHINTIILTTLYDGDKHGNDICREIEDRSQGQYEMKQPTLYSSLKRLEQQGLVKAYWGGVVSGGRRRYFKLTEQGREEAERNISEWVHSKSIIDKLVNNTAPEPIDLDALKKEFSVAPVDIHEAENVSGESLVNSTTVQTSYTSVQPVLKTVDDSDEESKLVAKENEEILNRLHEVTDVEVQQLSLIPNDNDSTDATKENETEIVETPTDNLDAHVEIVDTPSVEQPLNPSEEDRLSYNASASFIRKYTPILKELLPKAVIEHTPLPESLPIDEIQNVQDEGLKPSELADYLKEPTKKISEETEETPIGTFSSVLPQSSAHISFKDLHDMAAEQGFKLKSSDQTNKTDCGKLLINKLVCASALCLFLILMVELAVICFPFSDSIGFSLNNYLTLGGIMLVFPVITLINYSVMPKKTIVEIVSFKFAITTCLVIVFNLVLLTFAYALIVRVDFTSLKDVIINVVVPIIVFANIPLYFILKYVLIDHGEFYMK